MNTRKMRNTKGITLVALIVTIIVLLILAGISLNLIMGEKGITQRAVNAGKTHNIAGAKEKLELQIADYAGEYYQAKYVNRSVEASDVGTYVLGKFSPEETTFEENYYLKKENSKLILTSSDRTTTATCTVDSNGKVVWEGTEIYDDTQTIPVWTQNLTEVKRGDVTLEVGQAVTGYSVTATVDGEEKTFSDWYVLGVEDGKLLITMNKNPEKVTLEGRDGYTGGVVALNSAVAKYCNTDMAYNVRALNYDDINRITEHVPQNEIYEFKLKEDGFVWYRNITNSTQEYSSNMSLFEYWNGNEWKFLEQNKNVEIDITYSGYDASAVNSNVKSMLFSNTGFFPGADGNYWLGTSHIYLNTSWIEFGYYKVFGTSVYRDELVMSFDSSGTRLSNGVRPVISLKSSVKVTSEGVISND